MGISGLLPFLESISKKCHISEFRDNVVAVDAYCWLHKGSFSCSEKLVRGEETLAHINYCLKYVNMLLNFNITPILVFDGQHLEAKKDTELKRREDRKIARQRASELLALGKVHEARQYLRRCVDITHEMALQLIRACRKINVDCIVAPYEADAQLAFLNMQGIADLVITEDSDLLLFGCKKTLFKLNIDGSCTFIDQDKLCVALQMSPDAYSFDKFRYMCILSGCDYLKSLPGIGIKKAHKAFRFTHNTDITSILPRLGRYLNTSSLTVTEDYIRSFMIADATFKHQIVFNPLKRKQQYLTDPDACGTKKEFLCNAGAFTNEELAFQMALGNVDPFSKKVLDKWNPDMEECRINSIWSNNYRKKSTQKVLDSENFFSQVKQKITITKSKEVDTEEIEKEQTVYDIKLQEELNVYKSPPSKRPKLEQNEEPTSQENDDDEFVPSNPFIQNKEKRLSKFNLTTVNKAVIVKSKFFACRNKKEFCEDGRKSPSLIYNENPEHNEQKEVTATATLEQFTKERREALSTVTFQFSKEEIHKESQTFSLDQFKKSNKNKLFTNRDCDSDLENLTPPESSNSQNDSDVVTYSKPQNESNVGEFSNESSSIDTSEYNNNKQLEIITIEDSNSSGQNDETEKNTNHESLKMSFSQKEPSNKSVLLKRSSSSVSQSSWVKKCPRVGLSKKNTKGTQQTLLSMFRKMKSKD